MLTNWQLGQRQAKEESTIVSVPIDLGSKQDNIKGSVSTTSTIISA